MAIDCMACGGRVHETAVKCPHCGQRSGAEPTKPTAAEAAAIAQLAARRFYNELEVASTPKPMIPIGVTSGFAALGLVAEAISAAAAGSSDDPERAPPTAEVPRAIARERPRPPTVEPIASKAPEPAPPPSDQPRFLK